MPMPVQSEVIPILLNEKTDAIAFAHGTGKTTTFGLQVIQNINVRIATLGLDSRPYARALR